MLYIRYVPPDGDFTLIKHSSNSCIMLCKGTVWRDVATTKLWALMYVLMFNLCRFNKLFSVREKWTQSDIEPYIRWLVIIPTVIYINWHVCMHYSAPFNELAILIGEGPGSPRLHWACARLFLLLFLLLPIYAEILKLLSNLWMHFSSSMHGYQLTPRDRKYTMLKERLSALSLWAWAHPTTSQCYQKCMMLLHNLHNDVIAFMSPTSQTVWCVNTISRWDV